MQVTSDYFIDPVGLELFLSRAHDLANDLRDASPTHDGNLMSLADDAGALGDPDIASIAQGVLSDHASDLQVVVDAVRSAIASVEAARDTVTGADDRAALTLNSSLNSMFDAQRFSSPPGGTR